MNSLFMKSLFFIIPLLFSIHGWSQSDGICGTSHLLNSEDGQEFYTQLNELVQEKLAEGLGGERATIIVPLVFHIVYNTTEENIDDSLILQQVQILNDDFQRMNADTSNTPAEFKSVAGAMDVQFCLATLDPSGDPTTGILRVPTSETSFPSVSSYSIPDPVKHASSGGSDAWPTDVYMNIWICNLVGSTAYTAPPGNFVDPADDGIVCHYNHIGNSGVTPYGEGRSIVHEMGHWFGLKHIWGDDGGACTGTDFMADTPDQANWTGGCPVFPAVDACTATAPGIMFMNYMDYSEDGCRNLFTQDQCDYMVAVYDAIMPDYYLEDKCLDYTTIDEDQTATFKVYASDGRVSVSSGTMMNRLEIYNLQGQLINSEESNGSWEFNSAFDKTGTYVVRVQFKDSGNWEKQLLFVP